MFRHLKLDRPLVGFDLETTGTSIERDRIVEIALVRVEPDGTRRDFRSLVNPGMPIPPGATKVHGITDADVRDAPAFAAIAAQVVKLLDGADLAGYNSLRFDAPLLETELARVGHTVDLLSRRHLDGYVIFTLMEPRTLTAAYRKFCGAELQDAHTALADVEAALRVLDAEIAHYEQLPADVEQLSRLCNPDPDRFVDRTRKFVWNDEGRAVFTFGKYRDRTLDEVAAENPGYLEWMLGKDFGPEVQRILRGALGGEFPRRGAQAQE